MATFPDDSDGQALARLVADGVDLSLPRAMDFMVAVPDEQAASQVATVLAQAGYETEVYFEEGEADEEGDIDPDDPEFGPSWTVYVRIEMVPDYNQLLAVQADLDRLATPFGGKSDGWGTLVDSEGE